MYLANSGVFYSNKITVNAKSQPGGKIYDTQQQLKWEVVNSDSATTTIRFTLSALLSEKGQWYAIGPTTITYNVNGQLYTKIEDRKRCSASSPTIISWTERFLNNSSTDNVTVSNISSTSVNLGFSSDSLVISNKSFTTDKVEYIHTPEIKQDLDIYSGDCILAFDSTTKKYYFEVQDFSWEDDTPNKYVDKYVLTAYAGDKQEGNDKELSNKIFLGSQTLPWTSTNAYTGNIKTKIIPIAGKYIQLSLRRYKNNKEVGNVINTIMKTGVTEFYQVPGSLVYLFNNGSWITGTPWVYDEGAWRRGNATYIYDDNGDSKKSSIDRSIDDSASVPTKKKTTRKKKTTT